MLRALEGVRNGTLDGQLLVTIETTRRLYGLQLSKCKDVENICTASINFLDLELNDGRFLLSGAGDGSIYIHDMHNFSGTPQYTAKSICKIEKSHRHAHKYSVECVQWYPYDTGLFITSGMDKKLKLWDANRMVPVETYQFEGRVYQHHLSLPSAKRCLIAVASSINQVQLVDVRSGSSTHELRGHKSPALCCRWSPREDHLLATGSCDNRVLMWDVRATRNCLRSLDQHNGRVRTQNDHSCIAHDGYVNALCFTQDGLFLMSLGTDSRMRLWNSSTGRNELVNYGRIPNGTRKGVRLDVSYHSVSDLVYVPSEGNILAYEVHTGTKVSTLLGHYNSVKCCCYNPFYCELYSGSSDRNILVWSADGEQKSAYDEIKPQKVGTSRRLAGDNWSSDED